MNWNKGSPALRELMKNNLANPEFEAKRRAGLDRYWADVRAGKRENTSASAPRKQATKPVADVADVAPVAERMADLTAEEIVNAIQTRINDLSAENERLRQELAECRVARQNADRDVFELRKENRELAAQIRTEKDKRSGLRLFAGQSR